MAKANYRQLAKYAAARALSYGAKQYFQRRIHGSGSSSATARTSSAKNTEMLPLTSEKDVRTVYRKRRMPRRKKRRYVKRLRAWRNMKMRSEPARIFQYVGASANDAGLNTCNYFGTFYGMCANNVYGNALVRVFGQFSAGSTADEKVQCSHLRIDHMALDVVLRNVTVPTGTESGIIDLDVYKVLCIRDVPLELWPPGSGIQSMIQTLGGRLQNAIGMDVEVGDTGAAIGLTPAGNVNAVGSKLWNMPPFLRYFKIVKQWKVQVPPGGTVQFNMRTSKNRRVPYEEVGQVDTENGRLAAKAYVTAGYIFNENGRWDRTLAGWSPVTMNMEQYTRYNCKPLSPQ